MINQISVGEEIYAIHVLSNALNQPEEGSEWFGSQHESLQASRMKYKKGKSFKVHYHILNPRTIKRTQEAFVVISGKIAVDVYSKSELLGTLEAGPGEAILVYRGGHGVRVLEDVVMFEFKAGAYTLVSEDKTFMENI